MINVIGETAGKVWHFLDEAGEANLNQIKKGVPADLNLILQAIGWLAREDKLVIEKKGRFVTYALKK
ncbi:MAG: winged helix-turn-helix domain-containing protein [Thermodesulfobacteriota bacterium]